MGSGMTRLLQLLQLGVLGAVLIPVGCHRRRVRLPPHLRVFGLQLPGYVFKGFHHLALSMMTATACRHALDETAADRCVQQHEIYRVE